MLAFIHHLIVVGFDVVKQKLVWVVKFFIGHE
jgi:hypothetical protein